jgi:hypothetical protein
MDYAYLALALFIGGLIAWAAYRGQKDNQDEINRRIEQHVQAYKRSLIETGQLRDGDEDLRWIVTVTYRRDLGEIAYEFHIEQLAALQAAIAGPDWNCLDRIEIRLNPKRRAYDVTIKQAAGK